ncbi:MAG TPA: tetratricopeptide repeat protein [Vicinamibacteria bacterium]
MSGTMRTGVVLAVALGFFGTVGAAGQKKEDIILAELRQIQATLAELQSAQAALSAAMETLSQQATERQDTVQKTFADSKIALERVQEDMSILSERVDETNSRLAALREDLVTMRETSEPIVIPPPGTAIEQGTEAPATPPVDPGAATTGATTPPPAVLAAGPSVIDLYNEARNDYTLGRYPLAISGFKDVLELDKRGDLADNARYWMGESYLAQRQLELALGEFDRIIRDYPNSNKRPDAYLKKAMTLEEMGRRAEANTMYELVIEQFPRTTQERVARRRLEDLMRSIPR